MDAVTLAAALAASKKRYRPKTAHPTLVPAVHFTARNIGGSGLVVADTTALASWSDISGNARNAAQATGTKQPTKQTVDGRPTVRFDGVDDVLTVAYTGEPCTVFAVVYSRNTSGSHEIAGGTAAGTSFGSWYFVNRSGNSVAGLARARTADTTQNVLAAGTLAANNEWQILVGTFDPTARTVTWRTNGTPLVDTVTVTGGTLVTSTGMLIGAAYFNGTTDYADIDLSELRIYDTVLTEAQIETIGLEMSARWSIPWATDRRNPLDYPYLAAFFGNGIRGPQVGYLMGSMDGQIWRQASDINPVVTSTELAGGVAIRDPSIYKHTDGYWYCAYTNAGTSIVSGTNMGIARTADLRDPFQHLTFFDIQGADSSWCRWAPEFYAEGGSVYVVVSISSTGTSGPFQPYYMPVTLGASPTFGAQVAITGTSFPANMIDACIVKVGTSWKMTYKDEGTNKSTHVATSTTGPFSGYVHDPTQISTLREGQCLVRVTGSTWRLYYDAYSAAGGTERIRYKQSTDDMATWGSEQIIAFPGGDRRFVAQLKHGTVLKP